MILKNNIIFKLFENSGIIASKGSFALGRANKRSKCVQNPQRMGSSPWLPFADHSSCSWDLWLEPFLEGVGKEQDEAQTQSPCNQ